MLWKNKAPPKVACFGRVAARNACLTQDMLQIRDSPYVVGDVCRIQIYGVTAIPDLLACTFLYHWYAWAETSYSKTAQYHIKRLCVGSKLINSTFQEK